MTSIYSANILTDIYEIPISSYKYIYVTVVAFHHLLKVSIFLKLAVYSVLMNVNDLFTLTHFHLFQLDII